MSKLGNKLIAAAQENVRKYHPNGKPLTGYERELLILLMEECAEVIQAASKVLRFGKDDQAPMRPTTNTVALAGEIGDLIEIIDRVDAAQVVSRNDIEKGRQRKRERLAYYMQTSR